MKAPVGALVQIGYDTPDPVAPGDVLKTTTGRCYIIIEARQQIRGIHAGRWHLQTVVIDQIPDGALIHPIEWYRR
jgi:hypothetical protein